MLNQALLNDAIELHRAGRLQEASQKYRDLLALNPQDPGLWNLQGVLAGQVGDYAQSIELIHRAIDINPAEPEYYRNLAISFGNADDHKQEAEAYNRCANALQAQQRFEEALSVYDAALLKDPGNGNILNNRGTALNQLRRFEEAETSLRQAVSILNGQEGTARAYVNLGRSLQALQQFDAALEAFEKAVAAEPESAYAHWAYAELLLLLGRWPEGWDQNEWRWKAGSGYKETKRNFPQPLWQGETPEELGGPLLVVSEQGFGDVIHVSRYIMLLVEQGHEVIFEVHKELYSLLREALVHPKLKIISRQASLGETYRGLSFSAYIGLLSLPKYFGTTPETVPLPTAYLTVQPTRIDHWRKRLHLDETKLNIGIVRGGNLNNLNEAIRSIPVEQLAPLFAEQGTAFYSLQKDGAISLPNIVNLSQGLEDFADTAAIIKCLDLVICVDTSVAHLAAALGQPTWLMLPTLPDWRWLLARDTSPWYLSIKLFRQTTPYDWEQVIAHVHTALAEVVNQKRNG